MKKLQRKKIIMIREQNIHTIKIAVALDASFNFYYKENLDMLRKKGAATYFFQSFK